MMKPLVHLNGTNPEDLSSGYAAAMAALGEALDKLEATAPNARDYYPLGSHAAGEAMKEHHARVARVKETLKEVAELYESVEVALEERAARKADRMRGF